MVSKILLCLMVLSTLSMMSACNLPSAREPLNDAGTETALGATLTALPMMSPLPPSSTATIISIPTATAMPLATAAPQDALVLEPTLCWVGPGPVYEVVSALKKSERVKLLGRGSIGAWWIVENPIYHDPCWVMAQDLQIDPTVNTAALQVFVPPPTPTASFTPSPSFTPTFTSTSTMTPTPTATP